MVSTGSALNIRIIFSPSYNDFELINGFISLRRGIFAVFQNFPTVKKGVAQKTKLSISSGASSFRGDSRDIIECPGSGIRFITITPIFTQKSTSYDWARINYYWNTLQKTGRRIDAEKKYKDGKNFHGNIIVYKIRTYRRNLEPGKTYMHIIPLSWKTSPWNSRWSLPEWRSSTNRLNLLGFWIFSNVGNTYICLKESMARTGRSFVDLPRWLSGWANLKPSAWRKLTVSRRSWHCSNTFFSEKFNTFSILGIVEQNNKR